MSEAILEFVDSRGVAMRVDRQLGIIRGVKVLGLQSRNGRTYLAEALERAIPLYEGAKVNVNHPKASPLAARDYQDRIGNLRQVSVRAGQGLFADFHFNPKHALAEQLVWDAEHAPENVGFSHNVLARIARQGNRTVVEAITQVQSVDLVADPATTQGLFESAANEREQTSPGAQADAAVEAVAESSAGSRSALTEEGVGELERVQGELAQAQKELERLRASESLARRQVLICRLLDEAGLSHFVGGQARSSVAITERFLDTLIQAPNEQTVRELIHDRAALIESLGRSRGHVDSRPRSRDQSTIVDGQRPTDTESFVRAIT